MNKKDVKFFQDSFMDYNGNLLRHQNIRCTKRRRSQMFDDQPALEECYGRYTSQMSHWRTLIHFVDFNYISSGQYDVTLVSQLTYDRWNMFEDVAKQWEGNMNCNLMFSDKYFIGPISVAIYATDQEFSKIFQKIKRWRKNIAYHVVFKEGNHYPYNKLRNVAIRNVVTRYVFLVDVDFVPMPNLYNILRDYVQSFGGIEMNALIVPAILGFKKYFPNNKTELIRMLDRRILTTNHPGQEIINYKRWRKATQPYNVKWRPRFEPYIVVESNVTEYDERFVGYGGDKISHIMELEAQGYKFTVLPDVYILHKTHPITSAYWEFRRSEKYITCLNELKQRFQEELVIKYGRKLIFV